MWTNATGCAYCAFRPSPPDTDTGRPDHPDNWRNGIGDGAHSPYYCQPFMRFLCEGEAEEAHRAYLRRLIILGRSRR